MCNALQRTATHCTALQFPASPCNILVELFVCTPAAFFSTFEVKHTVTHNATQCNTLQHHESPCITMQKLSSTTARCNTLVVPFGTTFLAFFFRFEGLRWDTLAKHCNTSPATHCNTLGHMHHAATHLWRHYKPLQHMHHAATYLRWTFVVFFSGFARVCPAYDYVMPRV